jgi:hypothetical protein
MSRVIDSSINGALYALERFRDQHRAASMRPTNEGLSEEGLSEEGPRFFAPQWQDISRSSYISLVEAARPYLTYVEHSRDWSYIIQFYDVDAQAKGRAGNAKLLEDLAASADTMVQRRAGLPDEQQWRQIAELRRRKLNEREPA